MRIVCISDTHNRPLPGIPDGDVLVHAGDLTMRGSEKEVHTALDVLLQLPHRHKVLIAGNHDFAFERDEHLRDTMKFMSRNVNYLHDSGVTIDGVRFWGSPWQPAFYDWAFNLPRGPQLAAKWALIPDDTQFLVTHGPAYGYGDRVAHPHIGEDPHVGCHDLLDRIRALPLLQCHVYGHIHEGYGMYEHAGVTFVNASTCTQDYRPVNPPVVIDL